VNEDESGEIVESRRKLRLALGYNTKITVRRIDFVEEEEQLPSDPELVIPPTVTQNFHGPVGANQVGDNNVANIQQQTNAIPEDVAARGHSLVRTPNPTRRAGPRTPTPDIPHSGVPWCSPVELMHQSPHPPAGYP